MDREKIMVIDGNSIINRAYYGLHGENLLQTSYGLYTNGLYGFVNILAKYLDEEKPGYICVAFDTPAKTFRHESYDGYKANRKGMPEELAVQLPVLKELLGAMGIKGIEYDGFEADDLIGWITSCAEDKGMDSVIVTGDKDSFQLISENTRVKYPVTRFGKTDTKEYDYDKFKNEYGIEPSMFVDVKALMGDSSDNIPGIRGIGEKTALSLISEYESLDNIYENIDNITRKALKKKLEEGKELAYLSRDLSRIKRSLPKNLCTIDELKFGGFNKTELYEMFKKLEFNSFIDRFNLNEEMGKVDDPVHTTQFDDFTELSRLLSEKAETAIYAVFEDKKGNEVAKELYAISFSWKDKGKIKSGFIEILGRKMEFYHALTDFFERDDILKYTHDFKELLIYLISLGIEPGGFAFDTSIGAYILNPAKGGYFLSDLAGEFAGLSGYDFVRYRGKGKSRVGLDDIPKDELSKMICNQSEMILAVKNPIGEEITRNQQEKLFYEIEMPLGLILARMEYTGFKVNREELASLSGEMEVRLNSLTDEIYEGAGEKFNINSTKQLGTILFDKLSLPVIKRTKTGYSTDVEVLEELKPLHPIISLLLEYRHLAKLKSTYADGLMAFINEKTGKIHSSFNQTVVVTGRISSTDPNLQNIPVKMEMGRRIRKVFTISSDEYVLTDADYSQIELRVLAHISEDPDFIRAFAQGEDIHSNTAAKVFKVPVDSVTPTMRNRAKAINFGIIYGIGDFSLGVDLGVSRTEARRYIDEYLDQYPGVRTYMENIVKEAKKMGYVKTLFNRRRYLPELGSSNFNLRSFGERVALNAPIQGSAADIIKISMVLLDRRLREKKMKSRLILQVHDELIVETHRDEMDEVHTILRECMEKAVSLKVPLVAEIKTGVSWYDTK